MALFAHDVTWPLLAAALVIETQQGAALRFLPNHTEDGVIKKNSRRPLCVFPTCSLCSFFQTRAARDVHLELVRGPLGVGE